MFIFGVYIDMHAGNSFKTMISETMVGELFSLSQRRQNLKFRIPLNFRLGFPSEENGIYVLKISLMRNSNSNFKIESINMCARNMYLRISVP